MVFVIYIYIQSKEASVGFGLCFVVFLRRFAELVGPFARFRRTGVDSLCKVL